MIYKMPDGPFEIFSNDYGCFDRHTLAEVRRAKSYTYFAGDSFAWGYGNYDQNIPTTYEKISHQFTVKCGIPHSGQKHQYEKFQQIVKLIGKYPKRVILTFYENDVANDYAYPHTTVIEGYEVDIYSFNPSEFKLIPRDMLKIERSVRAAIQPENLNTKDKIATWLDKHSITWNLFKFAANKTQEVKNGNIYDIGEGVNFGKNGGYANADVSRKNRDAIDLWVGDAQRHGYELIFILIPPKIHHANTHFYDGLKESLNKKKF